MWRRAAQRTGVHVACNTRLSMVLTSATCTISQLPTVLADVVVHGVGTLFAADARALHTLAFAFAEIGCRLNVLLFDGRVCATQLILAELSRFTTNARFSLQLPSLEMSWWRPDHWFTKAHFRHFVPSCKSHLSAARNLQRCKALYSVPLLADLQT